MLKTILIILGVLVGLYILYVSVVAFFFASALGGLASGIGSGSGTITVNGETTYSRNHPNHPDNQANKDNTETQPLEGYHRYYRSY